MENLTTQDISDIFNPKNYTPKDNIKDQKGAKLSNSIKDIVYAKKDKDGKTIWMKVGIFITKENGKQTIKLDAIPVGFDGWFTVGQDERGHTTEPDKAF